jgi:Reeler domain
MVIGQLVIIQGKQANQTFKGIAIYCHEKLDLPLLTQNKDLKALTCISGGGHYISHKNPTPKKAVGFFFKGDRPVAANETMFVATILESYTKYWRNCVF